MNEFYALFQTQPWLMIGAALVAFNLILFAFKVTKKLILLALGAVLIAVGVFTGVIDTPALLAFPFWTVI